MTIYLKEYEGKTTGSYMGRDDGYPCTKHAVIKTEEDLIRTFDPTAKYYTVEPITLDTAALLEKKAFMDGKRPELVIGKVVKVVGYSGGLDLRGKTGKVESFNANTSKFEIDFGQGWIGHFKFNELKLMEGE